MSLSVPKEPPGLADVLDRLAPRLDQRERCALQATCSALREAGLHSKVVNWEVIARVRSDDQRASFLLWLEPRAHAVKHLTYGEYLISLIVAGVSHTLLPERSLLSSNCRH